MSNKKIPFELIVCSFIVTIMIMWPFFYSQTISYEHDTFFHLSRIEGYANALLNFDFFPKIYPFKNNNFGYASSLFYCDLFLLIPSLIYNLTHSLVFSYQCLLSLIVFFTSFSMGYTVKKLNYNLETIVLSMLIYSFSSYHLSDLYARSALGELFGFIFLPLVILGIYNLLFKKQEIKILIFSLSCLILTHNLSLVLAIIMIILLLALNYQKINLLIIKKLIIATIITTCLTSFYTFPLLEQLFDQKFLLSNSSSIASTTLYAFQYFQTNIYYQVFSNNPASLTVSVGCFILLPLFLKLFVLEKNKFLNSLLIAGLLCLVIQSKAINYQNFNLLNFIQFIWRFSLIATCLLTIPASYYLQKCLKNKQFILIIYIFALFLWTSKMATNQLSRVNTLNYQTSYQDIIQGKIVDPYYGNTPFKRVELAAGDYLPINYPDFRDLDFALYNSNFQKLAYPIENKYNEITFSLDQNFKELIIPKTYYKGYYLQDEEKLIPIIEQYNGLIILKNLTAKTYTIKYQQTFIQKLSLLLSFASLIFLIIFKLKKN